jgi:hypothetical protein
MGGIGTERNGKTASKIRTRIKPPRAIIFTLFLITEISNFEF